MMQLPNFLKPGTDKVRVAQNKPPKAIPTVTKRGGGFLYDLWDEVAAFEIQCHFADRKKSKSEMANALDKICSVVSSSGFSADDFLEVAPKEYETKNREHRNYVGHPAASKYATGTGVNLWDTTGKGDWVHIWSVPTIDEYFALFLNGKRIEHATDGEIETLLEGLIGLGNE